MQRAGRRAKKDNTNKAKSSKGAANANQNVVNINLGDLMEKHSAAAPKKRVAVSSADGEPARKQPKITDQQMDRLKRLKQEYTQLSRSTDMRMIPEGCRDVPDRLLHPRTPEQVRELADYLQSCIRNIGLRSAQGIRPTASGIRAAPSAAAAAVPSIPGVTGPTVPTTPFYQLPAAPLTQEEKYLKEELPAIIAYLQQLEERLREADEKKDMAEAIKGFQAYEQIAEELPALVSMSTSNEEVQELQQQARAAFEGLKQALDAALGLPEEPAGPEDPAAPETPGDKPTEPLDPQTPSSPELQEAIRQFMTKLREYTELVKKLLDDPNASTLERVNRRYYGLRNRLNAEPLGTNENRKRQEVKQLQTELNRQHEQYAPSESEGFQEGNYVHQLNSAPNVAWRRNTFARVAQVLQNGFLKVDSPYINPQQGIIEIRTYDVSPSYVITSDAAAYEAYEQRLQNQIPTPPKQPPPGNNSSKPPWSPGGGPGGLFGAPPPVPKPPLPKPPGGFPSGGGPKKPDPAPGESP